MGLPARVELEVVTGPPLPGRAERADAAANRTLILETAERLFAERGVAAVNMADIAEAAGVGKGTLYRRFTNKSELALSLLDHQMADFQSTALAAFDRQTAAGVPYLEQLANFLDALVRFTDMHSPLLCEVERSGMLGESLRLDLPHVWQYMTVNALLGAAVRQGELIADIDTAFVAQALLAPLKADVFRFQRDVSGFSLERISDGLRTIVRALGALT